MSDAIQEFIKKHDAKGLRDWLIANPKIVLDKEVYEVAFNTFLTTDDNNLTNAHRVLESLVARFEEHSHLYRPHEFNRISQFSNLFKDPHNAAVGGFDVKEYIAKDVQHNLKRVEEAKVMSTSDGRVWKFKRAKTGGANEAGDDGGVYQLDGGGTLAMIKQEPDVAKNIAEFLGAQVFQATNKESSANVFFAHKVDSSVGLPNDDGKEVYVASEFIDGYKGDLFKDIFATLGKAVPEERPKLLGMIFKSPIAKAFKHAGYKRFPEVSVTSLLIGDFDIHTGNIGWVEKGTEKHLVRIDYAAAFEGFEDKVHPDSSSRHPFGLGPTNHFKDYPEELKVNQEFVSELDMVGNKDLSLVIDNAFKEIDKYYGPTAMKQFAAHVGMDSKKIVDSQDISADVKEHIKNTLKARQADILRFSAQLKSDMSVELKDGKKRLNAEKFMGVMKAHEPYFREVMNGEERFKFRATANKVNHKVLKSNAKRELCAYFALEMDVSGMDRAYDELMNGAKLKDVEIQYKIHSQDNTPSLLKMALDGEMKKDKLIFIQKAIECGSNPRMRMPDGEFLIDKCKDFESKKALVYAGAKLTKNSLKDLEPKETDELRAARRQYIINKLEQKISNLLVKGTKEKEVVGKFTTKHSQEKPVASKSRES